MAQLSEQHGISRGTARRVLTTLRNEGLITITPGWGSFVAERPGQPTGPRPLRTATTGGPSLLAGMSVILSANLMQSYAI